MTAPFRGSREAQDEKAGDDVRVLGDHWIGGVWGFTDGFGGQLRRGDGPEQLLRWRVAVG